MTDYSLKAQKEFYEFIESKKKEVSGLPEQYHKEIFGQIDETVKHYEENKIVYLNKLILEKRKALESKDKKNPLEELIAQMNDSLLKIKEDIDTRNKNIIEIYTKSRNG